MPPQAAVRALGNAMAVPVIGWILERIAIQHGATP